MRRLDEPTREHIEAVRLSWMSHHFPLGSILLVSVLLAGVVSALSTVFALGPVNPIP